MKYFLLVLMIAGLIFSTVPISKVKASEEVTMVSAEAVFETTTNDKDHDSYVAITVKRGNTVIASSSDIGGHWNDHSTHNVTLNIGKGWARSDLKDRTKTELSFSTNGNDKWEYNYILRLN